MNENNTKERKGINLGRGKVSIPKNIKDRLSTQEGLKDYKKKHLRIEEIRRGRERKEKYRRIEIRSI